MQLYSNKVSQCPITMRGSFLVCHIPYFYDYSKDFNVRIKMQCLDTNVQLTYSNFLHTDHLIELH